MFGRNIYDCFRPVIIADFKGAVFSLMKKQPLHDRYFRTANAAKVIIVEMMTEC